MCNGNGRKYLVKNSIDNPHFFKNVTLSCPTGGMIPRAACHWLTHNSYWLTQLSAVSSPTSPGQYTAHAQ